MSVRKQITVPPEVDRRLRRLARQQGIAQSALPDPSDQVRSVLSFADIIKDSPPRLSEEVARRSTADGAQPTTVTVV
jgi:hypothetical protein